MSWSLFIGIITLVRDQYTDTLPCPSEPYHPTTISIPNHPNDVDSIVIQPTIDQSTIKAMLRKNSIEVTIHGIANAESYAIDLFWDLIARYTTCQSQTTREVDDCNCLMLSDSAQISLMNHSSTPDKDDGYLLPLEFYNGNECNYSNHRYYDHIIILSTNIISPNSQCHIIIFLIIIIIIIIIIILLLLSSSSSSSS